ncbi:putative asparagine synthetase [glutamine-hydrolyzing] [Tetrabaena socialis]|uniref:Asparagine synthetase [glutamine-hydrolyzing] n=1 Tax=Tetrabaena socialis TaxID=47790 RepID=A0A2J7ZVX8_9CHLO|nr:putative asparagine synthetase [glutamine-hydrolyzing] [Tetrabaena socialis]|eukprot:PNH04431.1 putative asparagine synthetase [glutamine-hydrolyzing] [Tetrabaena socialis]
MQPFVEGEDVLIGTGEVWNYQELDADVKSELKSDVKSELKSDVKSELKSDVEVFLRMEMTADQIDRVDGDFAFVRSAPGRFWAARDVAGVRPLFYATDASQRPIAFASEAKALVAGPGVAKVHVFPPGHVYDSAVDALVPYHTRPIERQVRSLLTLAVTKRLIHSDRPASCAVELHALIFQHGFEHFETMLQFLLVGPTLRSAVQWLTRGLSGAQTFEVAVLPMLDFLRVLDVDPAADAGRHWAVERLYEKRRSLTLFTCDDALLRPRLLEDDGKAVSVVDLSKMPLSAPVMRLECAVSTDASWWSADQMLGRFLDPEFQENDENDEDEEDVTKKTCTRPPYCAKLRAAIRSLQDAAALQVVQVAVDKAFVTMAKFKTKLMRTLIETPVGKMLIVTMTKRLIHSDRPVGILCSGGVDSAIITSIAARLRTPSLVHVFTMEYENSGSQDAFYARMLCQFHGFQHTVVSFSAAMAQASIREVIGITETYDPNTIRAAIPMFLLAKHIAEQTDIKVILSGEGADELFAGYLYFMGAPSSDDLNRESRRLLGNLHMFDLLRADRCFAAFSLEVRVPYLDKDLVDYVTCVQGHSKRFRNGAEKMLLRDAFENLQELKDLRILERPKERFSDGCGFSYVPDLLNYVSDGAPRLQEKLEKEKQYYLAIFDELYTEDNRHWITSRELPAWASGKVQDVGLDV